MLGSKLNTDTFLFPETGKYIFFKDVNKIRKSVFELYFHPGFVFSILNSLYRQNSQLQDKNLSIETEGILLMF